MIEEREREDVTRIETHLNMALSCPSLEDKCTVASSQMIEGRESEREMLELKPSTLGLQPNQPAACLMGDWADLPPELLNMILVSRELELESFSLVLVCKCWNNAVASTNSVPFYLMVYHRRTHSWRFRRGDSSLFVSFPRPKNAEIRCSKYGWLLMSRSDNTLFFFNPCSKRTIKIRPNIGRGYTIASFIHPPTSRDCIVVGIQTLTRFQGVGICIIKLGEHERESKEYPTETEFSLSHGPPVCHRGQIYFLDVKGNVARYDLINRCLVSSDNCLEGQQDDQIKERYLFKLGGKVFGAFVFHGEGKVKVFRLSAGMKWDLVEDIGDNVVFLSPRSSMSLRCCTAATKNMANRIYFPMFHGDSVVFYSLSDAKYHSLDGVYSADNITGLRFLEKAAWVTPAAQFTTENS